jgi:hypothetical protein
MTQRHPSTELRFKRLRGVTVERDDTGAFTTRDGLTDHVRAGLLDTPLVIDYTPTRSGAPRKLETPLLINNRVCVSSVERVHA